MNIYSSLTNWLKTCPYTDSYIFFNVIPFDAGATSVVTVPNIRSQKQFSDGSLEITELFKIDLIKEYDPAGTSDINLNALATFENITSWIEAQTKSGNLPSITGLTINHILPSYTVPDIFINETDRKVRYEAQYEINYLERS